MVDIRTKDLNILTPMTATSRLVADQDGGTGLHTADALRVYLDVAGSLTKQFGAIGDDATLNDAAIALALASGLRTIRVPSGVFRYSVPFTVPDGQRWVGQGSYGTILRSTFATGDCITLGVVSAMRDIGFRSTAQRSSGVTVRLKGNLAQLLDFEIDDAYIGASIEGTSGAALVIAARIQNGVIRCLGAIAGAGGIDIHNFASAEVSSVVVTGTLTGPQCDYGIRIRNGDTCIIGRINATRVGRALYAAPDANENLFALNVTGCYFDSAAASIDSAWIGGYGNVYNTLIANTWFGLAGANGCVLQPFGAGIVDGTTFTGCEFTDNTVSGLSANGTLCKNVVVTGGHSAGNAGAGLYFGAAQDFTVTGHRAGPVASRGPNGTGIVTNGAANGYVITGNNLRGNTTAAMRDEALAANKTVASNLLT